MRILFAIAAVVSMLIAVPLAAQEPVTLSRYRLVGTAPEGADPSDFFFTVDLTPLNERCRDLDGCEVSLQLENGSGLIAAKYGRIYVSATSADWVDIGGTLHTNGNNIAEAAATATGSGVSCALSDRDLPPNNDPADSYTLIVTVPALTTATCTLTVID